LDAVVVSSYVQLRGEWAIAIMCHYGMFWFQLLAEQRATICELNPKTIECPSNQNIVIKKAQYGHIGISECVEVNTGHFGCVEDISTELENKCQSSKCLIDVHDGELRQHNPCRRGLDVFIQMEYFCIQGKWLQLS
jgi:hypothetical protein